MSFADVIFSLSINVKITTTDFVLPFESNRKFNLGIVCKGRFLKSNYNKHSHPTSRGQCWQIFLWKVFETPNLV